MLSLVTEAAPVGVVAVERPVRAAAASELAVEVPNAERGSGARPGRVAAAGVVPVAAGAVGTHGSCRFAVSEPSHHRHDPSALVDGSSRSGEVGTAGSRAQ